MHRVIKSLFGFHHHEFEPYRDEKGDVICLECVRCRKREEKVNYEDTLL